MYHMKEVHVADYQRETEGMSLMCGVPMYLA